MQQSLSGLKVIEIATYIAGPYCAMILGDHGADVVKVERPGGGDENRAEPPFINGESAPFMLWNRNKRSVVLDLKTPNGKSEFLKLITDADVLIENMRPGAMDRLGLGFAVLRRLNPRLIYAAVSGYGRTGPLGEKGGFDLVLQGYSGLMSMNGPEDGPPFRMPISICDVVAGTFLANGVLLALQARTRTGEGQMVETSLFETALSLQLYEVATYLATGKPPERLGQRHRGVAPYQVFATADGYITIGVAHQAFWERFCKILDRPSLATNLLFASNADRVMNAAELAIEIENTLRTKSCDHWLKEFDRIGIPCGPIQGIVEALTHPQAIAREMIVDVDHTVAGRMQTLGVPVKLSATPGRITRPAPTLGQHTREIVSGELASADRISNAM